MNKEPDATLAEVVAAMKKYNRQKLPPVALKVFDDGGGAVRQCDRALFTWGPSGTPGRAAVEAIQAHTEPAPTAAGQFEEVALYAYNWRAYLQRQSKPSSDIGSSIDVVRRALEGDSP